MGIWDLLIPFSFAYLRNWAACAAATGSRRRGKSCPRDSRGLACLLLFALPWLVRAQDNVPMSGPGTVTAPAGNGVTPSPSHPVDDALEAALPNTRIHHASAGGHFAYRRWCFTCRVK